MTRVGVISDTHGSFDKEFAAFFSGCDLLLHCGDWGDRSVLDKMRKIAPVKGVYGNIDGNDIRIEFPEYLVFEVEKVRFLMIHIGGYPGRYSPLAKSLIRRHRPKIQISGHSHILKVINDPVYNLLHINPGAAGNSGFHKVKTALKFDIDGDNISNLKVLEVKRNRRI